MGKSLVQSNPDIQVYCIFVLFHNGVFHVGDMDQIQNIVPVYLTRLLQHLRRILQCFFHLLQMQDSLTDQVFLQLQRVGNILRIIIDRHSHDLFQGKTQVF